MMNQSTDDTGIVVSVIDEDGEPIWQACAGGHCVRHRCGATVLELLKQAQLNSQPQPLDGPGFNQRGLSPRNE